MIRCARVGALLLLPLAACAESGGVDGSVATIDTLPNGAVHVRNAGSATWDSASAWRFVEETRIGSMEGEGPDVFADVRDIEVDGLGRVWILDAQQKKIEVFEPDGQHVRTVGRPGAGPGELEYPIGIERDQDGRMWVLDAGNSRYTVFDSTGALAATHRRESTYTPWRWEGGITDDGRVFDTSTIFEPTPPDRDILIELDGTGATRDTVDLPQFEQEVFELRVDGRLRQTSPVPFTPALAWTLAEDGTLWFGTSDDYRLINRTLAGDTLRIVEKEWTPVPVTPEDRTQWLEMEWLEEMREQGAEVDPSRIPPTKPAWSTFRVDEQGYLWVLPTRADAEQGVFDVFDPEGRYLGEVSVGTGSMPLVRGDRVYVVVTDEMDVPYVVIGRLVGRN